MGSNLPQTDDIATGSREPQTGDKQPTTSYPLTLTSYYIIPRKQREGRRDKQQQKSYSPVSGCSTGCLPTSPRRYALAWALLRHQCRLTGVTMPSRTFSKRSLIDFSEHSTDRYSRSYTFQIPTLKPSPLNFFFRIFGHLCIVTFPTGKWELGEASPPDSRHRNRKSGTTNWRETASLHTGSSLPLRMSDPKCSASTPLLVTNQSIQLVNTSMNQPTNQSIYQTVNQSK